MQDSKNFGNRHFQRQRSRRGVGWPLSYPRQEDQSNPSGPWTPVIARPRGPSVDHVVPSAAAPRISRTPFGNRRRSTNQRHQPSRNPTRYAGYGQPSNLTSATSVYYCHDSLHSSTAVHSQNRPNPTSIVPWDAQYVPRSGRRYVYNSNTYSQPIAQYCSPHPSTYYSHGFLRILTPRYVNQTFDYPQNVLVQSRSPLLASEMNTQAANFCQQQAIYTVQHQPYRSYDQHVEPSPRTTVPVSQHYRPTRPTHFPEGHTSERLAHSPPTPTAETSNSTNVSSTTSLGNDPVESTDLLYSSPPVGMSRRYAQVNSFINEIIRDDHGLHSSVYQYSDSFSPLFEPDSTSLSPGERSSHFFGRSLLSQSNTFPRLCSNPSCRLSYLANVFRHRWLPFILSSFEEDASASFTYATYQSTRREGHNTNERPQTVISVTLNRHVDRECDPRTTSPDSQAGPSCQPPDFVSSTTSDASSVPPPSQPTIYVSPTRYGLTFSHIYFPSNRYQVQGCPPPFTFIGTSSRGLQADERIMYFCCPSGDAIVQHIHSPTFFLYDCSICPPSLDGPCYQWIVMNPPSSTCPESTTARTSNSPTSSGIRISVSPRRADN